MQAPALEKASGTPSRTLVQISRKSASTSGRGNEYVVVMTLARIPLLTMYGYKAENLPQIVGKAKAIRTSKAYFQHDREAAELLA